MLKHLQLVCSFLLRRKQRLYSRSARLVGDGYFLRLQLSGSRHSLLRQPVAWAAGKQFRDQRGFPEQIDVCYARVVWLVDPCGDFKGKGGRDRVRRKWRWRRRVF